MHQVLIADLRVRDGYFSIRVGGFDGFAVWGFRWEKSFWPGFWVVTSGVEGFGSDNYRAVCDDFGNLVRVPS